MTYRWLILLAAVGGCARCDREPARLGDAGGPVAGGDASPEVVARPAWPELAALPVATASFTATIPGRSDVPLFDIAGPVVFGDVAVVSSSAAGFVGVELGRGRVVWTRTAGLHVAPPAALGDAAVLVGDCPDPVALPDGEVLLGCLSRLDPQRGTDLTAAIVRGARDVASFAGATGEERLRIAGDGLRWQRGELAVQIDPIMGNATPAPPIVERAELAYRGAAWRWVLDDEALVAYADDREVWRFGRRVAALIGAFGAEPPQVPVVRAVVAGHRDGRGVFSIVDVEGLTGGQGAAAHAFPGIQVLATAFGAQGVTVLAVRLDSSLSRDYIAAFDGNGLLLWVWPLPERVRTDAVGLAADATRVVVFHDGDRLTVLPLTWEIPTPAAGVTAP